MPQKSAYDLHLIAKEQAQKYAPQPRQEPFIAGIGGAFIAGLVVTVFSMFAGLDRESFPAATAWTSILGFAVPYFYVRSQQKAHDAAVERELALLNERRQ